MPTVEVPPILLTKKQAAAALQLSPRMIERLGQRRLLPVTKLGKSVRYPVEGINAMIAQFTKGSTFDQRDDVC